MVYCCIPCCKSEQSQSIKLYRFPTDDQRRQLWIVGCRRLRPDFVPSACHRLCEVIVIELIRGVLWCQKANCKQENPMKL